MQRLTSLLLLAFVALTGFTSAQSLADVIPADTLLYAKLVDPVGDFEKLTSSGDIWARPDRIAPKARNTVSNGLKKADDEARLAAGTMDTWMRSIGSIELAVFSFDFDADSFEPGGLPPTIDFAIIMESPLAIEMYNQFSGMLIDSGQAQKNERGDLVISGGGQDQLFSIQGTRVILAGSEDRLNKVVAAFKQGRETNPLSSSAQFKTVAHGGTKGARVVYMRLGPVLRFIADRLSESAKSRMENVVKPLGLYDVEAAGYYEDGANGVFTMKGDKEVPLFKILKGNMAPPAVQGLLPEDTAFAFGHAGDFGEHFNRIQTFLTDPAAFPPAVFIGFALTGLTSSTGLSTKALTEPIKEGFTTALVPNEDGSIDPQDSLVILAKVTDPATATGYMDKISKSYGRSNGVTFTKAQDGPILWLLPEAPAAASRPAGETPVDSRPSESGQAQNTRELPDNPVETGSEGGGIVVRGSVRRAEGGEPGSIKFEARAGTQDPDSQPTFRSRRRGMGGRNSAAAAARARDVLGAYVNGYVIMGKAGPVKRVVASVMGKAPTLQAAGAFARLPEQATFYMNVGLRSIFKASPNLGSAFNALKGTQAIGVAITATDTTMTAVANRASGQVLGILMGASLSAEDDRDNRTAIVAALRDIGEKTMRYAETKKAWPKSLEDLGYAKDKMPSFADAEGKMKPIVFLPPKGSAENPAAAAVGSDGKRVLLAYWDSSDMGRLAVALDGGTWSWTESEFIGALRRYNGN